MTTIFKKLHENRKETINKLLSLCKGVVQTRAMLPSSSASW